MDVYDTLVSKLISDAELQLFTNSILQNNSKEGLNSVLLDIGYNVAEADQIKAELRDAWSAVFKAELNELKAAIKSDVPEDVVDDLNKLLDTKLGQYCKIVTVLATTGIDSFQDHASRCTQSIVIGNSLKSDRWETNPELAFQYAHNIGRHCEKNYVGWRGFLQPCPAEDLRKIRRTVRILLHYIHSEDIDESLLLHLQIALQALQDTYSRMWIDRRARKKICPHEAYHWWERLF